MTLVGWLQIALYCAVVLALVKPLGWYMTRVFSGEKTFLSPVLRPVEVGLYKISGVNDRSRTGLAEIYRFDAAVPHRRLSHPLCLPAHPGRIAVQSARHDGVRAGSVVQHRHQLHHEHELAELWRRNNASYLAQMLGLTHQNFLSAATGIVLAVALIRGFARHSTSQHRQLLGRRYALHTLHPAADLHPLRTVPGLAGHSADASGPLSTPTTLEGAQADRLRSGLSPRKSPSRCSAPTAAASSTPMPRIRSRTRRRCRTSFR